MRNCLFEDILFVAPLPIEIPIVNKNLSSSPEIIGLERKQTVWDGTTMENKLGTCATTTLSPEWWCPHADLSLAYFSKRTLNSNGLEFCFIGLFV